MSIKNKQLNSDKIISSTDDKNYIQLIPPEEFSFNECLAFMGRSNNECLHHIEDNTLHKLIRVNDEFILLRISYINKSIRIGFPVYKPNKIICESIVKYVRELFDLERELKSFYLLANNDFILSKLIRKHYGLRIIGIPDLFEAVTWAIMGQQINLTFAYTLKRRFVEEFGEKLTHEGNHYWLFPTPETISRIDTSDLIRLQFTTRKAEYIIGIAKLMTDESLSKEGLLKEENYEEIQKTLVAIRGWENGQQTTLQ